MALITLVISFPSRSVRSGQTSRNVTLNAESVVESGCLQICHESKSSGKYELEHGHHRSPLQLGAKNDHSQIRLHRAGVQKQILPKPPLSPAPIVFAMYLGVFVAALLVERLIKTWL